MFCNQCGTQNSENVQFCSRCGATLASGVAPTPIAPGPAAGGPPGTNLPPGFVPPPTTSGKAVASLLFSFLFFFFIPALGAIVLGHLALSDIKKSAGRLKGHGIAVTGLVLGYLGVVSLPFILIIAAIAIPNLVRSRMAANQASAVSSLRQIDVAATSYNVSYVNGFPPSLATLGGLGTASCDHAALIDGELASGQKNGYVFTYQAIASDSGTQPLKAPASGCSVVGGAAGFTVTAVPITVGTTGQTSYYTDASTIIRYQADGSTPTADSPPLQ
jgi:type IV pilus assembly protein PilA